MDVEWLTYDGMAERLGMGRESARTLAKRKRWGRQTGNDGRVLIGVPVEEIEARQAQSPARSPARSPDASPEASEARSLDRPADRTGEPPVERPEVLQVLTRHIERLEGQLEEALRKVQDRDLLANLSELLTGQVEALRAALAASEQDRDRWHQVAITPAPQPLTWWRRLVG